MAFEKTFDELLNDILTDWRNQFPEADTSQGSLIMMQSAGLASALWGLYQAMQWISRQIFPDTAVAEYLEHHAWVRGVDRRAGETDAELLARLLEYIRRPPAGGNRYDYVKWAMEIANVKAAYCVPLGQGVGTVDTVIIANPATGSEIPTQGLIDAVKAHIDDVRPVTAKYTRVLAPTFITQAVTVTGSGAAWDKTKTAADITAYLNTFVPEQPLYRAQLVNIAVLNGADDATVTVPADTVTPTGTDIIRPGVVSVP